MSEKCVVTWCKKFPMLREAAFCEPHQTEWEGSTECTRLKHLDLSMNHRRTMLSDFARRVSLEQTP